MKKILIVIFPLLGFAMHSCMFTEENLQDNVIQLEELIYLSSNKVRLLARVVESDGSIDDHGFYLSLDKEFTNPIIRSLGNKDLTGLYFSEIDSLSQTSNYYYKAYFSSSDNTFFSEAGSFSTFEGAINSVSSLKGKAGEITKILGKNFTNDLSIKFGNTQAKIVERLGDFEIWVEIPNINKGYIQPIVATMEGISYTVDTFYYETGKWSQLSNFNRDVFYRGVTFQDNNKVSVGLGVLRNSNPNNHMYVLDLSTSQWTEETIPATVIPVEGAFSTPSGYFGSGSSGQESNGFGLVYILENSFYKYDDGSYTMLAPTPFASFKSYAMEYNGSIYVIGGRDKSNQPIDIFYKYESGAWVDMGTLPFKYDTSYPAFTNGSQSIFTNKDREMWLFDAMTETLIRTNDFPSNVSSDGIAQVVQDQLVYGLFVLSNLVSSTDPNGEVVLEKLTFPGDKKLKKVTDFAVNDAVYILRGSAAIDAPNSMEFWKFEPFEFTN